MKPSKLKKDKTLSLRINGDIKKKLAHIGYESIQKLLDEKIDSMLSVEIKDEQLVLKG
jgi:hypothetical protein